MVTYVILSLVYLLFIGMAITHLLQEQKDLQFAQMLTIIFWPLTVVIYLALVLPYTILLESSKAVYKEPQNDD